MHKRDTESLSFLGKKYVYTIMKHLEYKSNQRFKDIKPACPIEKMRNQRLREMERVGFVGVEIKRMGRRPISVYSLSDKGRKILRLMDELKKIL